MSVPHVRARCERGQASVELVGAIPAVLLAALVAWQIALAGHAAWASANAARVGARAGAVGRDARAAVRGALPSYLRRGLRVEDRDGAVRVRVRVPMLLPRFRSPVTVSAAASLEAGP